MSLPSRRPAIQLGLPGHPDQLRRGERAPYFLLSTPLSAPIAPPLRLPPRSSDPLPSPKLYVASPGHWVVDVDDGTPWLVRDRQHAWCHRQPWTGNLATLSPVPARAATPIAVRLGILPRGTIAPPAAAAAPDPTPLQQRDPIAEAIAAYEAAATGLQAALEAMRAAEAQVSHWRARLADALASITARRDQVA